MAVEELREVKKGIARRKEESKKEKNGNLKSQGIGEKLNSRKKKNSEYR